MSIHHTRYKECLDASLTTNEIREKVRDTSVEEKWSLIVKNNKHLTKFQDNSYNDILLATLCHVCS